MTRFGFNIKTRTGQRVDNICIMAANQADAERRLRQMYHQCEIGIISNGPATVPAIVRSMLRNKSGTH